LKGNPEFELHVLGPISDRHGHDGVFQCVEARAGGISVGHERHKLEQRHQVSKFTWRKWTP
jgi:hypothetical protein